MAGFCLCWISLFPHFSPSHLFFFGLLFVMLTGSAPRRPGCLINKRLVKVLRERRIGTSLLLCISFIRLLKCSSWLNLEYEHEHLLIKIIYAEICPDSFSWYTCTACLCTKTHSPRNLQFSHQAMTNCVSPCLSPPLPWFFHSSSFSLSLFPFPLHFVHHFFSVPFFFAL